MSDLTEALRLWLIWDAHERVMAPYKVCLECRGEWPCGERTTADKALREMGIDPFAVRRHEVKLEGA